MVFENEFSNCRRRMVAIGRDFHVLVASVVSQTRFQAYIDLLQRLLNIYRLSCCWLTVWPVF